MIKRYKYRIYPNKQQQEMFQKTFGCCRFVYNWALDIKIKDYEQQKEAGVEKIKTISTFEISRQLTQLKKLKDYEWLNEVPSTCFGHVFRNLDSAYKNFFRRVKQGGAPGFPKFKSKHNSKKAFGFHQNYEVNFDDKYITVPKSGKVKAVFHRRFEGDYKTTTIYQEPSGKYYASIVVDDGKEAKQLLNSEKFEAVDHGVVNSLTLSNGMVFNLHLNFDKTIKRIIKVQRSLSRKKKGSSNFNKTKIKLAKLHERIRLRRKYLIENGVVELMRYLVKKKIATLAIRKYDVQSMIKKKEPIKDGDKFKKNGRAQQRELNKKITNAGLGMIYQQILTKAVEYGITIISIDADEQKTTAKCYACGNEDEKTFKINLKTRKVNCKKCGYIEDMDYNAAKNIKAIFTQSDAA